MIIKRPFSGEYVNTVHFKTKKDLIEYQMKMLDMMYDLQIITYAVYLDRKNNA
jgi:hypothetical protein